MTGGAGVERHINFFELREAAEKPGCPLCRIAAERGASYIDNMLFEHVSDRGFRAKYRAAGGFCPFHSRGLEEFRDGLAVAILGRDVLEDHIAAFEKLRVTKPGAPCPVCEERDRLEEEYLSFLSEAWGDGEETEELKRFFTASAGLCIPHYAKLLTIRGKPRRIPPWLREFQEAKFKSLYRRVSRFIELSAYGRQGEFRDLSDGDQRVWKELAAVLRGG
jgi:hypothetical protein